MAARKKAAARTERRLALVMDTETTGLIENGSLALDRQPEIIEFCGLLADLSTGKVVDELDVLIRPSRPLEDRPSVVRGKAGKKSITEITGITNEMLNGRPTFAEASDGIFKMVEGAPLVIAQNASFDKEMLDIEAARLGLQLEWPPLLCSIEQTVHLRGYRLALGDLHEHLLGKKFEGAHRARADVEALLRCLVELCRRGDI